MSIITTDLKDNWRAVFAACAAPDGPRCPDCGKRDMLDLTFSETFTAGDGPVWLCETCDKIWDREAQESALWREYESEAGGE